MPSRRHVFPLLPALLVCAIQGVAAAQQQVGELYATDASVKGAVVLAGSGTGILSGSSIQAGAQSATLKLDRGGSLLVCEGTKLSITASQTGRELLFSLNSGNLEMNYPLGAEADTLLTPDLRLLLPGPGAVHVAVRVTPQGDTCVQTLPANVSSIVVSETMGDATYQVKPNEAVMFKAGHLGQASVSRQNCGCPPAPVIQMAKQSPPPAPVQAPPAQPVAMSPPPPERHVMVEAPFVYRAEDPTPDLAPNIALLKLDNTKMIQLEPTVLPPPNVKKKPAPATTAQNANKDSHGFFGKIGSFFGSIFH